MPPADDGQSVEDHSMATRIATTIGRGLPDLRRSLLTEGISGAELGAAGDRHAQATLEQLATELNPGDVVLSEEGVDDPARLTARRVWIIDPLDGTREFSEPNRHDWAVHVALVVDGAPTAAAVHLPDPDTVLTTSHSTHPATLPTDRPVRIVVSRTRPPAVASVIARALDAEIVHMGSAGAKAAEVVCGEAEIYLHDGGMNEWDACAPAAVAASAGLHVSHLNGSALVFNKPRPSTPDLLICHPRLADEVLALVDAERDGSD